MPTDSLVDVEVTVKLVNVRKSQVGYANQLLKDLFHYEDLLHLQDKQTGQCPWDLNLTIFGLPRVIDDAPTSVRMDASSKDTVDAWISKLPEPESCIPLVLKNMPCSAIPVEPAAVEPKKAYQKLPADIDEKIVQYLRGNKGAILKDIVQDMKYKESSLNHYIEKLVKDGRIRKEKDPERLTAANRYFVVEDKPVEISKPLKEELKKAEVVKGEFWAEKTNTPMVAKASASSPTAKEKSHTLTFEKPTIEPYKSACHNALNVKDDNVKAYLLENIEKTPGLIFAQITHDSKLSSQKVRNLLIELEEEHKIRRDVIETSAGIAKTAYFPAKVTANGTGGN